MRSSRRRRLYQAKAEPVPIVIPTIASIVPALSEPRNPANANRYRVVLAVSGGVFVTPSAAQPEDVTEDRFHQDWSNPRYMRLLWLRTSAQQAWIGFPQNTAEDVTESRFHFAWSEPRRYPRGVLRAAMPAAFLAPSPALVAAATIRIDAEEEGDATTLPIGIFTKLDLANVSISEIKPRRANISTREGEG